MSTPAEHALWDGDGLPDDDDEILELFRDLGCLPEEVVGIVEVCKREAWVHEHVAKHEDHDRHIAIARYFWRRTDRLKRLADRYDREESETPSN